MWASHGASYFSYADFPGAGGLLRFLFLLVLGGIPEAFVQQIFPWPTRDQTKIFENKNQVLSKFT